MEKGKDTVISNEPDQNDELETNFEIPFTFRPNSDSSDE